MPTETHRFTTPSPITLHLRSQRGSVEVIAGDVTETVVDVTCRHEGQHATVTASADGSTVTVDVPRTRRLGSSPRLDIVVRLPQGSAVELGAASASITTTGLLRHADVQTASGSISVEQVTGDVEARSASGSIRLGAVRGTTRMRTASGDLSVATATGHCTATSASGAVDVGWAGHDVAAKSASGDILVRDAVRGTLSLRATSGDVTVGVRKGTLVWLDLSTVSGRTRSDLTPDGPSQAAAEETLAIRASTVSGNITVAPSASAGARVDDRRQPA